jgi:hypothetical protein
MEFKIFEPPALVLLTLNEIPLGCLYTYIAFSIRDVSYVVKFLYEIITILKVLPFIPKKYQ